MRVGALTLAALLLGQPAVSAAAGTPQFRSTLYEAPLGLRLAPDRYLPLAGYQAPGRTRPDPDARHPEPWLPQEIIDLIAALSAPAANAERPGPRRATDASLHPTTPNHSPDTDAITGDRASVGTRLKTPKGPKFSNIMPALI